MALDLVPGLPQVPVPQELGLLILLPAAAEPGVRLVGGTGLSCGRSRGSCTDSAAAITSNSASAPRSRAARIMRPMRGSSGSLASSTPVRGELAFIVVADRAQLGEQRVAVTDQARAGRVDEGEVLHRTELQGLHAQDHAGERGPQDLRIGVRRAAVEIVLVVEADADAVHHTPAAPGALLRGRPGDLLDLQLLDLVAASSA